MTYYFFTLTTIPYPNAESIHVMQIGQALTALNYKFVLYRGLKLWRWKQFLENTFGYYGMDRGCFSLVNYFDAPFGRKLIITRQLKRLVSDENAVVHCRDLVVASISSNLGLRTILEIHEIPSKEDCLRINDFLGESHFLGVVVITSVLKEQLLLGGVANESKVLVAPDGVDPDRFSFQSVQQDPVVVGYVGSLNEGKGIELVLEIAQRLPRYAFEIFGGKKRQIRRLKADHPFNNIRFHGHQSYRNIPECMKSFSIALLPNQPEQKLRNGSDIGFVSSPMKLFEYMACGKTVLASDLPMLREIIEEGKNGYLLPHNNVGLWVDKIVEIAKFSDIRHVGENARKDVETKFSYRHRMERILSFFQLTN